jgi:hypothetical protein
MADSSADNNAAGTPAMPWHIVVKIDSQSDVPAEWQGSLADWLSEQVGAHVASVALTDAQFESLFPAQLGAGAGAGPAPEALSHGVFELGTAEQGAGEPMLAMLHGHPEFVLFFDGGGHVAIA